MTHHQLVSDYERKRIKSDLRVTQPNDPLVNFLHDSFYDKKRSQIHCFYWYSQSMIVKPLYIQSYSNELLSFDSVCAKNKDKIKGIVIH